ncbi:MAG: 4-Hydroxybenzoate polyprenyltransferase-like protein [Candidatus Roizmanbacteria bacterium GW2011_GWA2_37_7]|uniref:4-Hydroxybenzoate polyprenyltransferase-like protein n=1 Tax=Candidatus Roizmanbacteria bacterium GW2011_GWA2_37_7 TaxID=1618481 RepID=A0A0G0HK15_9BACT|nr:MAG: 4-Hydroxybenzoate polyprenyltransferase-like protein [Candidatus Roizmanbacteria bacterium GW2011_GWA2_37_7]
MKTTIVLYLRAIRANQWIKNFIIFAAILFGGKLFEPDLLLKTIYAFFVFCLLSSASYVLNDIIDYQYDKKHPMKKYRPIASGAITIPQATFLVFVMTIVSLLLSLFFSLSFFFISLIFLLLHFYYSLYLKRYPVVDIFTISFSFVLRTLAGVVVTGYHVPIWLLMTIFFVSLFMASVKRHAELVANGRDTRESLFRYKNHMLYFLSTTFATLTIVSYALYTYTLYIDPSQQQIYGGGASICKQIYEKQKDINECEKYNIIRSISSFSNLEARKLMMLTVPFVVYGIARYAQLLYEKEEGERPEKIITTDRPLLVTMFIAGLMIILLIYVF